MGDKHTIKQIQRIGSAHACWGRFRPASILNQIAHRAMIPNFDSELENRALGIGLQPLSDKTMQIAALFLNFVSAGSALIAAVFWYLSALNKLPPMLGYWNCVP
jgi:hypothetical protein